MSIELEPCDYMTHWEVEIATMQGVTGRPLEECQKDVMLRWLRAGDARPVAHWLASGLPLPLEVSLYLAGMLDPKRTPMELCADGTEQPVQYSFRLVAKPENGRRKGSKPETDVRDVVFARQVRQRMEDFGETLEIAVANIAEMQGGSHLEATVKKAYIRVFGDRGLWFWPIK